MGVKASEFVWTRKLACVACV